LGGVFFVGNTSVALYFLLKYYMDEYEYPFQIFISLCRVDENLS